MMKVKVYKNNKRNDPHRKSFGKGRLRNCRFYWLGPVFVLVVR